MNKWDIIKATCNNLNIYSFTAEALEKLMEAVKQESKREWVGLTGDEQDVIERMANDSLDAICLTEAKLKEKNT